MAHTGVWYHNSKLAPASAEETQSAMMARDLLVDGKGNYAGDDRAIFAKIVTSDNDTRAPYRFIYEQNLLIRTAANNLAEHLPYKGHVMKCKNNALFKICQDDKSYSGVNLLSNLRMKTIVSDIKEAIDHYETNGLGDDKAWSVCLQQLEAIVPHQLLELSIRKVRGSFQHVQFISLLVTEPTDVKCLRIQNDGWPN